MVSISSRVSEFSGSGRIKLSSRIIIIIIKIKIDQMCGVQSSVKFPFSQGRIQRGDGLSEPCRMK